MAAFIGVGYSGATVVPAVNSYAATMALCKLVVETCDEWTGNVRDLEATPFATCTLEDIKSPRRLARLAQIAAVADE